jgi:hypothetical protein
MGRGSILRLAALALLAALTLTLAVYGAGAGLALGQRVSGVDSSLALAFSTSVCPECPGQSGGTPQPLLDSPALPLDAARPHPHRDPATAEPGVSPPVDGQAVDTIRRDSDPQTYYVVLHALANLSPDDQTVLMSGMERALLAGEGAAGPARGTGGY